MVCTAGQVLWTTYSPQIHWAGPSGSLCVVSSDQATGRSLSWPGLSSPQAQILSYQESLVHRGENMTKDFDTTFKKAEDGSISLEYFEKTCPQKDGLDFATVLSLLLLCAGIKDIFGRNACIRNALPVTYHPYENIRNAVLRLQ